ncbi:MAG: hypothetical protein ACFNVX_04210 [Lachnoanaerobaculum saburreum]|jgi:hypothetical protein
MGCRCGDMRRCRTDIRKVNHAITLMEGLRSIDSTIRSDLLSIAGENSMYMTPYNIGNITETESQMHREIELQTSNIIEMLKDKEEYLNDELKDMEDEDYDYHHRDDD